MNVLFFGDIVGKIGRDCFLQELPALREKHAADMIIINGENSANGRGITSKIYQAYIDAGVTCITSGNHVFDNKEIIDQLDHCAALIRPLNYPHLVPGSTLFQTTINGVKVAVVNLLGQVFMPPIDHPFHALDKLLATTLSDTPIIIVDIHAEATSEKKAFGFHFDGRVSAIIGTHTHVQTSDAEIMQNSTGYITDVGMAGAKHSILGMEPTVVLNRFLTAMPEKMSPPEQDSNVILDFVAMNIDDTGRTISMEAFHKIIETQP